MTSTEFFVVTI